MNEALKKQIDDKSKKYKTENPTVYKFGYGQALADLIAEFWRREDKSRNGRGNYRGLTR